VPFVVRRVSTLVRKSEAQAREASAVNPFLPPDPALTIGDITSTHTAVLNKYPVVQRHLLLVTKQFAAQEELLDATDFDAFAWTLAETDGLALYNCGRDAGASQPHKHLQLVPLPLGHAAWDVPMEALFDTWSAGGGVLQLLRVPFRHAFALLEPKLFNDPARAAVRMHELYAALLEHIIGFDDAANDPHRTAPYNLLLTQRWMFAIPRARERFDSISIGALSFAGSIFVRNEAEMARLREAGPMNVLKAVVG
jgi:sulfate adenylyltransferase (ADP) / ATP adenylyltransferase